jgi:hypothetical protein
MFSLGVAGGAGPVAPNVAPHGHASLSTIFEAIADCCKIE